MAYKIYKKIFQDQKLNNKLNSDTLDYDFSFSLKNNNNEIITNISSKLNDLFTKLIYNYSYTFDKDTIKKYNLKYNKVGYTNFKFITEYKFDRLHIKVECDIMKNYHILELSFWYNNKVSDDFTINDFIKNQLFIYNSNKLNYYLLPLHLLAQTTFYAIFDYLEKRNYEKCYKYIQRIKFIKLCNDEYINNFQSNLLLKYIFVSYKSKIRKKYKIINDYPFILADQSQNIERNNRLYLTRCIHTDYRNNNIKNANEQFFKYEVECIRKVKKGTIDKYTEDN